MRGKKFAKKQTQHVKSTETELPARCKEVFTRNTAI